LNIEIDILFTMCGIFALLNATSMFDTSFVQEQFHKGQRRGPEFSKLTYITNNTIFGFHRLAINGLNEESNQPFNIDGVFLICNGEIYNYKQLYESMNVTPKTHSDCEVIIHLYNKYGIEQTLLMLDGVFAFVLYDTNNNTLYVARDPFGVRPLYILKNGLDPSSKCIGFASELKCLSAFQSELNNQGYSISHVAPGTYSKYYYNLTQLWRPSHLDYNKPYILPSISYSYPKNMLSKKYYQTIVDLLNHAIIKRCETTERPIACLLSGGLDSSLIAALVANYGRTHLKEPIETYSIGLEGSEDVKYAKIVAEYIGSNHHEIIVTEEDMFHAIPEVIEAIESYDTTTVRASIGNYLVGKYIATHSQAKVIFNGDGSDELFGGYLYMNKCPDDIEFDKETRRLLKDIHIFDVLRSDKSISSNGLEPRTPFLDRSLVNYVLSLPASIRNHTNKNCAEKELLRRAFADYFKDDLGRQVLPDNILWRRKEAFSDGVSSQGRSLFTVLQNKIKQTLPDQEHMDVSGIEISGIEIERAYYKKLFDSFYPHCAQMVPYFWMPKYIEATDPSARTLSIY